MTLVITRIAGHDVFLSCPRAWDLVRWTVSVLVCLCVEVAWVGCVVSKGRETLKEREWSCYCCSRESSVAKSQASVVVVINAIAVNSSPEFI